MIDHPHAPAAFINAINEEGTKAEAISYLQKTWNENCALRKQLAEWQQAASVEAGLRREFLARAASRWQAEVANRPLQNVHRRTLDDTWRQVIRHFGGDDEWLCGPPHDELFANQTSTQEEG